MSQDEIHGDGVPNMEKDEAIEEFEDVYEESIVEDFNEEDEEEVLVQRTSDFLTPICITEPKELFSTDSDETLDEDFEEVGSFIFRRKISKPPDFFAELKRIPKLDEISIDESIERFIKRTASIDPFAVSDDGEEEEKVEEEHVEPAAPTSESSTESSSSSESDFDFDFYVSSEDEKEIIKERKKQESDDDLFARLVKVKSEPIIVEPDFEELARQAIHLEAVEIIPKFLNDLLDAVEEAADYVDPNDVLRENLDKMKLFEELSGILTVYNKEKKVNKFILQKCVMSYRRKKMFRPITADPDDQLEDEKQKFRVAINVLDELLGREVETKKIVKQRVDLLEQEVARVEKTAQGEVREMESCIRKTFSVRASDHLNALLNKFFKEMAELRWKISEIRCVFIQRQHTVFTLKQENDALQNLGNGLWLKDFENLRIQMTRLEENIEDRCSKLDIIRGRFTAHVQTTAHLRESVSMMFHKIHAQAEALKKANDEKVKLREHIFRLKTNRIRVKKEIREISFQNGLIGKAALLQEFDETVEQIDELKETVDGLKMKMVKLERRIEKLEARLGSYATVN